MDFQILIASVWARTGYLEALLNHLSRQADPYRGRVSILVDRDNGQATVGVKRTRLLETADAQYVAFVDDDDWVSDDYVTRVMLALSEEPDAVGFLLAYSEDGQMVKPAIHSRHVSHWHEDDCWYYRSINHLNPVRRVIAATVGLPFQDGFGEDHAYADRLAPHLESEVFLAGAPVYEYRWSRAGSLFACGNRTVSVDPGLKIPANVRLLSDHSDDA